MTVCENYKERELFSTGKTSTDIVEDKYEILWKASTDIVANKYEPLWKTRTNIVFITSRW